MWWRRTGHVGCLCQVEPWRWVSKMTQWRNAWWRHRAGHPPHGGRPRKDVAPLRTPRPRKMAVGRGSAAASHRRGTRVSVVRGCVRHDRVEFVRIGGRREMASIHYTSERHPAAFSLKIRTRGRVQCMYFSDISSLPEDRAGENNDNYSRKCMSKRELAHGHTR